MVSRPVIVFLLLAPHAASAYQVHAPFFIEQHETGLLRAVVFHGTREGDETFAFCGNDPETRTGENEVRCFKVGTNEYELQLPYTVEHDPETTMIRRINFNDDRDDRFIIPFSTVLDDHSRMHAVVNAGGSTAYEQIIVPYSIYREGGEVFAVEVNENDEEQVVRLRYRRNGDGFMSIIYDDSLDSIGPSPSPAKKFGIVAGVSIGLAFFVLVWKKSRSVREPAGEVRKVHELHWRGTSSFA